jgi:signal transduction histidine kinase
MKYFNIITSEINRMNSLVTNFLSISRPPELNLIKVDVLQVLEEVIITLEGQAKSMNIQMKRDYENEAELGMFDHNQLKQVFQNIILNAFEAMPDGGEVVIKTSHFVSKRKEDHIPHKIKIQFIDKGCGISPEKIPEIFEFYYTTKKTGTGLGLVIAKQIIEGHKGEIKVTSSTGKGTAVTILLPLEG